MTPLYLDYCARHHVVPDDTASFLLGEKDTAPLQRRLHVIVPVSFAETGGCVTASCYPELRHVLSAHMERYQDALFSDAAFAALDAWLLPYLEGVGYKPAPFAHRWAISCVLDTPKAVNAYRILPQTVLLCADQLPQTSLVTMKLSDCAARGAFVIRTEDGTVCAIASVNSVSGAAHCTEIGVECAPAYRHRGYAASCTAALTRFLAERGDAVLYQYYHTNTGSAAVAKAVGFVPSGRFFAYSAVSQ